MWYLRVQFLEVGINEPLLRDLHELAAGLDEIPLAFKRSEIDLLDNLDGKSNTRDGWCSIAGDDGAFFREAGPRHESTKLGFVGQRAVLVRLNVDAAEYGRHPANRDRCY